MRERLGSIRVRTTAAAVLVVGVALALAAIAMVTLLERSLRQNVRTSAMLRAEEIVEELVSRIPADELGLGGAKEDEEFVQVVDADDHVVIASPNVAGRGRRRDDRAWGDSGDRAPVPSGCRAVR